MSKEVARNTTPPRSLVGGHKSRKTARGSGVGSSPSSWPQLPRALVGPLCFAVGCYSGVLFSNLNASRMIFQQDPAFWGNSMLVRSLRSPSSSGVIPCEIAESSRQHVAQPPAEVLTPTTTDNHSEFQSLQLPEGLAEMVVGFGTVDRDDFTDKFDVGYGIDKSTTKNNQVLILYGSETSLPHVIRDGKEKSLFPTNMTAEKATEHCDYIKIIYTDPKLKTRKGRELPTNQCIAVVGQRSSYHVHKFLAGKTDASATAKTKNKTKGKQEKHFFYSAGRPQLLLPSENDISMSDQALITYLTNYQSALKRLKPLAEKASIGHDGKKGPIIVLVANQGQSKFLLNLLCSARARKVNHFLDHILLFATDEPTYEWAKAMNLTTFYDQVIFSNIPSTAAVGYTDHNFGRIMMSKVYCVHMVNSLGHDLIYMDIDIALYQNPIDYFDPEINDKLDQSFDIYIQHDGHHYDERYAPTSGNTGFYFVRFNERTSYFFHSFMKNGDLVLADKSHQAAFTTLINEQGSSRGLRVKVLERDHKLFMSGFHYHTQKKLFRYIRKGYHKPYFFHANWLGGSLKVPVLNETQNWFVQSSEAKDCTANTTGTHLYVDMWHDCCLDG